MKNFLSDLSERVVENFGFDGVSDFASSIFRSNLLFITVPLTLISSLIENYFGLHTLTMISFITLITLELMTGIAASNVKNIPIQSKKFSRFGFKLGIWITLFFVLQSMKLQYKDDVVISEIYKWLHNTIFIYVSLEYMISVVENLSVITGETNSFILNAMKKSIGKYLKINENAAEEFFQVNKDMLSVIDSNGTFKKVNKAWVEAIGYDEAAFLSKSIKDFCHSEDVKKTTAELKNLKNGEGVEFTSRFKTKNDSYVSLSWNIKPGKNDHFYCTTRILLD